MCSWQRKQKKATSLVIKRHLRLIGKPRGPWTGPPTNPTTKRVEGGPPPSETEFATPREALVTLSGGRGETPGALPASPPRPPRQRGSVKNLKEGGGGGSQGCNDPFRRLLRGTQRRAGEQANRTRGAAASVLTKRLKLRRNIATKAAGRRAGLYWAVWEGAVHKTHCGVGRRREAVGEAGGPATACPPRLSALPPPPSRPRPRAPAPAAPPPPAPPPRSRPASLTARPRPARPGGGGPAAPPGLAPAPPPRRSRRSPPRRRAWRAGEGRRRSTRLHPRGGGRPNLSACAGLGTPLSALFPGAAPPPALPPRRPRQLARVLPPHLGHGGPSRGTPRLTAPQPHTTPLPRP